MCARMIDCFGNHSLFKFALENEQLFTEMSSMTSELKQIEGKVIEISRLQEVFAEKVLSQVHT